MEGPLLGFDTETTGTDVWGDRIVSAALVFKESFHATPLKYEWLIDPGVEIPEEASKIHGITTERARNEGKQPAEVLQELNYLAHTFMVEKQATLVAYNAPFDLTLLREDTERHGLVYAAQMATRVVDPLVIDKQTDKWRKGRRTLSATAQHFGIDPAGAHGALADVVMTMRIAYKLAAKFPALQVPAAELHGWQEQWKAAQDADYQQYLRKSRPDAVVESFWPVAPEREKPMAGGKQW